VNNARIAAAAAAAATAAAAAATHKHESIAVRCSHLDTSSSRYLKRTSRYRQHETFVNHRASEMLEDASQSSELVFQNARLALLLCVLRKIFFSFLFFETAPIILLEAFCLWTCTDTVSLFNVHRCRGSTPSAVSKQNVWTASKELKATVPARIIPITDVIDFYRLTKFLLFWTLAHCGRATSYLASVADQTLTLECACYPS
jgi:hypothetical protein